MNENDKQAEPVAFEDFKRKVYELFGWVSELGGYNDAIRELYEYVTHPAPAVAQGEPVGEEERLQAAGKVANELGIKTTDAYRIIAAYTHPAPAVEVNEQDELQPAANWIYNGLHPCRIADIQENLMVGYNRAKRLYDAAIAAAETQIKEQPK